MGTKGSIASIATLTTAVFDNGRRGMPRQGCDCEQCFGYCLVDNENAERAGFDKGTVSRSTRADGSLELDA